MNTCSYCGKTTKNYIELGRGITLTKIPCCETCFEEVDKMPQTRKDSMAEAAFMYMPRC